MRYAIWAVLVLEVRIDELAHKKCSLFLIIDGYSVSGACEKQCCDTQKTQVKNTKIQTNHAGKNWDAKIRNRTRENVGVSTSPPLGVGLGLGLGLG